MTRRPRVVLVIDRAGWAFEHIAQALRAHLGAEFDFDIATYHKVFNGTYRPVGAVDLTVAFWWPTSPRVIELLRPRRHLTCLFDGYSTRTPESLAEFHRACGKSSVAVVNHGFADRAPPGRLVGIVEDAVDTDVFIPRALPLEFTVGWTGSGSETPPDHKGLRLIREACELAKVKLVAHDLTRHGLMAHAAMPKWYGGISAYVCASELEGGPNPVLEAMACGRPVVSTAVGLVPGLVLDGVNGYVVERSVAALAEAIVRLRDMPRAAFGGTSLADMGAAARAAVLAHDRLTKIYQWRDAIQGALDAPA